MSEQKQLVSPLGMFGLDFQNLYLHYAGSLSKKIPPYLQECKKQAIDHVVVGLPLQLDGTEGRSAKLARQIGSAIATDISYEVSYCDERFSTVEASRRLRESGKSSRDQKSIIDQAAAMVIVEDWIRSQSNES